MKTEVKRIKAIVERNGKHYNIRMRFEEDKQRYTIAVYRAYLNEQGEYEIDAGEAVFADLNSEKKDSERGRKTAVKVATSRINSLIDIVQKQFTEG